jgi:putative oxidoreductase
MKLILSTVLGVLLGGVFIYSGMIKIMDPAGFFHDIVHYQLLSDEASWIVAHYLPWLEAIAGFGVIGRFSRTSSAFILTVLLLIFMGALGSAWIRSLNVECGCFGPSSGSGSYVLDLIRDLGLLLTALYLLIFDFSRERAHKP